LILAQNERWRHA